MLAIVLTCDRYRALTEHMIHCYNGLWPNHPFRFRIPYQTVGGRNSFHSQYVRTPPRIKETVLSLLMDIDDEQWIYWCIDDKYPIALDLERIEPIMNWLFNESDAADISGLLFCRCRSLLRDENLTGRHMVAKNGNVLLERRAYHQIWIHQFLRVKVLRHLFQSFSDDMEQAKSMDAMLLEIQKPASHRVFVSRDNLAIFGESTSRGKITKNCYESIVEKKLVLPDWAFQDNSKEIIMGKFEDRKDGRARMRTPAPRSSAQGATLGSLVRSTVRWCCKL